MCNPFAYRWSHRKTALVVFLAWLASIAVSIPNFIHMKLNTYCYLIYTSRAWNRACTITYFILVYIVPVVIMVVLNTKVILALRRRASGARLGGNTRAPIGARISHRPSISAENTRSAPKKKDGKLGTQPNVQGEQIVPEIPSYAISQGATTLQTTIYNEEFIDRSNIPEAKVAPEAKFPDQTLTPEEKIGGQENLAERRREHQSATMINGENVKIQFTGQSAKVRGQCVTLEGMVRGQSISEDTDDQPVIIGEEPRGQAILPVKEIIGHSGISPEKKVKGQSLIEEEKCRAQSVLPEEKSSAQTFFQEEELVGNSPISERGVIRVQSVILNEKFSVQSVTQKEQQRAQPTDQKGEFVCSISEGEPNRSQPMRSEGDVICQSLSSTKDVMAVRPSLRDKEVKARYVNGEGGTMHSSTISRKEVSTAQSSTADMKSKRLHTYLRQKLSIQSATLDSVRRGHTPATKTSSPSTVIVGIAHDDCFAKQYKSVFKILTVLTLTHLTITLPNHIYYLVNLRQEAPSTQLLEALISLGYMGFLNSCVNPIIYSIMDKRFRKDVKELFKRIF